MNVYSITIVQLNRWEWSAVLHSDGYRVHWRNEAWKTRRAVIEFLKGEL